MIIDFHTHVMPRKYQDKRDELIKRDSCFSLLYSLPKAKLATIEDLLDNMDQCQIDKSVILNIGWTNNEYCVETNDYILECVARYPQRIRGFCSIQPREGNHALKELERCIKAGAAGIGELRPDTQGFSLEDENLMKPMVELMIENDMILLLHMSEPAGHKYPGKGNVTPDIVYPFILDYPKLKIVCAHWGGGLPFYGLMPEVNAAFKNVFFDTAASPFLYKPEIYKHAASIVGGEKILFGSDYPLMSPERVLKEIDLLNLPRKDYKNILATNAKGLLKINS
jgi:uncharacterized protein